MAYIERRKNKKGELTAYRFRVYNGYDVNGKQMVQFRTWVPPEGMTPKQAEKEAQRLSVLFEEDTHTPTSPVRDSMDARPVPAMHASVESVIFMRDVRPASMLSRFLVIMF